MRFRPSRAAMVLSLLVLSTTAVSCPCLDSAVNSSPWLRWKIFAAFGAGRVCEEMTKRGAPLRMSDGAPIIGRFYPSSCNSTTNDDRQTVTLQFGGDGYAWTPITKRMSFTSNATVEYKPDFHMDGDTIYVWFRPQGSPAPTFNLGFVEQPVVGLATAMTPVGALVNMFAQQIVTSELARGFTVIHESSGDDFSLGILQPPARPAHPYDSHGSDRVVFTNESADVHANMLDFLGPFEIDTTGRLLYLRLSVSGPAVDVAVVPRDSGEVWRRQFQEHAGVPLPPSPPLVAGVVNPGVDTERSVPLPRGQYYVVIDNSPYVGQVAPPPTPLGLFDNPARTTYLVSMGDAP